MNRGKTGQYHVTTIGGEEIRAFVPDPLPPIPSICMDGEVQRALEPALLALGRLDAISSLLPNPAPFLYHYVRKEALLSSQIEGTQSSLSELMLFELDEAPGTPTVDVVEVSNYVAALEHGLARLKDGFPLSNRWLREMHGVLLRSGRGADKEPGEFRRSQNWIGGTRPGNAEFVPPPPPEVLDAMSALEQFMHDESTGLPLLVRVGLVHVQFETIHPFLDGNGRIGRLLITLQLVHAGVLAMPLLYLSLYLKQHRSRYYQLLDRVRTEGVWEEWLVFFLDGITETATLAVSATRRLIAQVQKDRAHLTALGRPARSALQVLDLLSQRPVTSVGSASRRTGLSFPAVATALNLMVREGIVRELTGKRRHRAYGYIGHLAILSEGTEQG
ncbi:MAG: Fic family protein [Gemmatimonadales bacterium]|nr:Fic family protein [Gemmatimonadales bacterium]